MPTLYRNGVSPAHQHFASSLPFPPPLLHPLGYVVESRQNHRRREIDSLKDLRKEIQAVKNRERLFVIHNRDPRVLEVLGIEASPARTWAGEGLGEWTWEYPHAQEDNRLTFRVVSLYARDDGHWTLLIDPPRREQSGFRPPPPRLKHQDAATRASALRTASHYGVSLGSTTSLDGNLCKVFDGEGLLPEALGELVFGRWLEFLGSLSNKDCAWTKERVLYKALHSLERNEDLVRLLGKKSQSLSTPSRQDISDLLNRLHRHMQLLLPPRPQASPTITTNASSSAASDRALNRISYIGGLLLPVTVVSSVLAIEGDYGPEGNNFWVFWVASVVASVVAVGLIHIDEVRGVEVWREVAEEIGILGADDEAGEGDGDGDNGSVRDGHGLVWERRQLGWGGAVKKVSGYYRLRGTKGLKFDRPDGR